MISFLSQTWVVATLIVTAVCLLAFWAWGFQYAPELSVSPEGGVDLVCEDPITLPDGRTVCLKYNEAHDRCDVQVLVPRPSGVVEDVRMSLDRASMRDLQRDGFYHLDAFLLDYMTPGTLVRAA